jgi:hypothetical protein
MHLIMLILRPHQELLERFSILVEVPPPPQSRYGSIFEDPFFNTVIEFELWPNALARFLSKARRALLHHCTMEDVFVDLEATKPTSGPFWLLWDLYKPILPNSLFMQAIYDGCVGIETIPPHLYLPSRPSLSDADPVLVVQNSVVDSDLMCCYQADCRGANRPIGIRHRGSYGLLNRGAVDVCCSGRTVQDFAVLNDRWATNATGSEAQFTAAEKNQYEERLFSMEDERVQLDVKICRMRGTLVKLNGLLERLRDGDPTLSLDRSTFPRGVLSGTQILTLRELYGSELAALFERILSDPITTLDIVVSRITDRYTAINEVRRNKESDYYDLNKRNYPRSLEVRHEPQQLQQSSQQQFLGVGSVPGFHPDEIDRRMVFEKEMVKVTIEMLNRISRAANSKDISLGTVTDFILGLLRLKDLDPLTHTLTFSMCRSITTLDAARQKRWMVSGRIARTMQLFYLIVQTVDVLLQAQPPNQQFDGRVEGARGICFAVALGHVSDASLKPNFAYEAVVGAIPAYFANSRPNPALEGLFEGLDDRPFPNIEAFKRGVQQFIKEAQHLAVHEFSQLLMDAMKIFETDKYEAVVLERLSKKVFYSGTTEVQETQVVVNLRPEVPLALRMKRQARIFCSPEIGPCEVWSSYFEDYQINAITHKSSPVAKAMKRQTGTRSGMRSLAFRFGPGGVEFRGPGTNVISRSDRH